MASTAFFSRLVRACAICRAVAFGDAGFRRQFLHIAHIGRARALQEHHLAAEVAQFVFLHDRRGHAREGREFIHHAADIFDMADDGVGAGLENFGIGEISFAYLRRSRSAESWIGVSGFLISCAMRRATSAQAALRCAESKIGHIVEGHDITFDFRACEFR